MKEETHLRRATRRMLNFLVVVLVVAVGYTFFATIGTVLLTRWGAEYEEMFYPPLDTMDARVRDKGQIIVKTFPPFQIEEMKWVSGDLLLVKGTLCKAQDDQFIAAHWFYGSPNGFNMPATVETQTPIGNRGMGCQVWRNWLLKDALNAPTKQFYADLTYRPPHNLWNVHYVIGPFDFPPRNAPAVVPQTNP